MLSVNSSFVGKARRISRNFRADTVNDVSSAEVSLVKAALICISISVAMKAMSEPFFCMRMFESIGRYGDVQQYQRFAGWA